MREIKSWQMRSICLCSASKEGFESAFCTTHSAQEKQ
jgi:hypothetical protein